MKKVMRALAAIMLMIAVVFAAGCTKDPNHNNKTTVPVVEVTEIIVDSNLITHFSGAVVSDGGDSIIRCGFCWGTQQEPDINGDHNVSEQSDSTFSGEAGLLGGAIYYVRAYAVNSKGIGYSDEVSFVPISVPGDNGDVPTGAINGKFTINENGDQVYFSQGNLQYQASTNTWRFAENQWDYVGGLDCYWSPEIHYSGNVNGSSNNDISPTYSGWIDLFGWGTSGWDCGNTYYRPWDEYGNYQWHDGNLYGPPGSYDLTGEYAHSDWGIHNPISNGGNVAGLWRTLTYNEWIYVAFTRSTSSGHLLVACAQIEGVNGVILLPDDWNSSYYPLILLDSGVNGQHASNVISSSDWVNSLQAHGAVFLPTAGTRYGTEFINEWEGGLPVGCYWSSSCYWDSEAYFAAFAGRGDIMTCRTHGLSVRLVCSAD